MDDVLYVCTVFDLVASPFTVPHIGQSESDVEGEERKDQQKENGPPS